MTTYCYDLDGTLCTNTEGAYHEALPFAGAIDRVNALVAAGHRVIIFTARGSGTGIDWRTLTEQQLGRWGVRYHDLRFGKPTADVFIDDRGVSAAHWYWGHTVELTPPIAVNEPGGAGLGLTSGEAAPQMAVRSVEVGRTFAGSVTWADDYLEALYASADAAWPVSDLSKLAHRLRVAVEPPEGILGEVGEVAFTLALGGRSVHPGLGGSMPRPPRVTVSCLPLTQVADAVDPANGWPGAQAAAIRDGRLHLSTSGGVTVDHVVRAAAQCGILATFDPVSEPDEGFFVSPLHPVLSLDPLGPLTRRIAGRLGERLGVDLLAQA